MYQFLFRKDRKLLERKLPAALEALRLASFGIMSGFLSLASYLGPTFVIISFRFLGMGKFFL